jgi:aryl-alcohol dehydrogenase-like predicted oxidoreductase
MGPGITEKGLSRKHIMDQIDASLTRLGLDYVDIYYCHRYDESTPLEETLRAMDDLITKGKVMYLGVSNWSALEISKALAVADRYMLDRIVVSQPPYNMFARAIETDLIPFCEENGIGQAVYSPLAQGILSGKYSKDNTVPSDSRAADSRANRFISRYLEEDKLNKASKIKEISDALGITMPVLALAWILRQKNVSSAIIGASRPEQVLENIKAMDVTLSDDVLASIDQILA